MKIKVIINGGQTNPYLRYGLKCNPFPTIPRAEYEGANHLLRLLDSDPIENEEQLRAILKNRVSDELRDICLKMYKPGERVEFVIEFPDIKE